MTRRPGMSLTEVLVALFILTLGVIGILTMFPLGAAQMARAVRDDRSAQAAAQADGYMRWYWQMHVVNPVLAPTTANLGTVFAHADSQFINGTGLFDNPASVGVNAPALNIQNAGQASYPVVVDPMGYQARGANFGDATATGYASMARCTLQYIPNSGIYPLRVCSLTDTLGFNDNGLPTPDMELRYNWMWVLQRPQSITNVGSGANNVGLFNQFNANNLSGINMTVVVFDRRAYKYPPSTVLGFEAVIPASFVTGMTAVTISATAAANAPGLSPGSWVMDASSLPSGIPHYGVMPVRQANFYRVVSVNSVSGNVVVELQTPIEAPTGYPPLGCPYTGTLVSLNGVSGVFVRPQLTPYPQ